MTYYLDTEIIKTKVHPDTVAYFSKKDDPIAPFNSVKINLLESALNQCRWDYYPNIEKKSAIFKELYQYFLNIEFASANDDIRLSGDFYEYPVHFFSSLFKLALCVS